MVALVQPMKFLLFILAFFAAANLLEAQQQSCREGPGVLKIIKETMILGPVISKLGITIK